MVFVEINEAYEYAFLHKSTILQQQSASRKRTQCLFVNQQKSQAEMCRQANEMKLINLRNGDQRSLRQADRQTGEKVKN